jgi:uncharacterized damage-inducible protein DinB
MNGDDLMRMLEYDDWANRECLKAMRAGGSMPAKTVGRMAHILSAEKLWLERLEGKPQSTAVWPNASVDDCEKLADEMAKAWHDYVETLDRNGLDGEIEYRNSKGEAWRSRVEDILVHVVMHSAYHRGQIALETRAAGMEPAYTDFIHAVRQGRLKG